jgi:hypothetical protein
MIGFEKLRSPIKMNYHKINEIIKKLLGQLQDLKPRLELARGKEAWVMQEGQDSEIVEVASKEAFNKFLRIIGSAQKNAHQLFDIIPNPLIENILGNLWSLDQPLSAVCFMDNNTGQASLQEGYIEDYINCKKDALATLRQLSQELSEISPPLVIWQNIISEIRSIGSQSATHKYSKIEGPPGPYNKIREEIAGLLNYIESAQKICIQVSENATTALVKLHHRVSDTKDLVDRNPSKGETPIQKLESIQDDLSQAFKKIEMEYRDLLEEFAVEFKVAHINFVTSAEAEQSASQKPARAGQGNNEPAEKTPKTDSNLIYQSDASEFYNIPKSTLSKDGRKTPGEPGYLWSGIDGRRRFYRKTALEKISRSRQKLKNV